MFSQIMQQVSTKEGYVICVEQLNLIDLQYSDAQDSEIQPLGFAPHKPDLSAHRTVGHEHDHTLEDHFQLDAIMQEFEKNL